MHMLGAVRLFPEPKVKIENIIFRPENWKWDNFDEMCSHMKRIVCKVKSDGYCLLNAVKNSLLHDYDNLVTLRKNERRNNQVPL